ncbi:hypothetical protein [Geodermatophilus sp. DSM 44513]|nr:hypothetical protein [Geodermatophilus sp. DSM 44513]WNV74779.1 hypothetical protein RTG05_17545 [Geodermatophilus sp. DSM 44513]
MLQVVVVIAELAAVSSWVADARLSTAIKLLQSRGRPWSSP